MKQPHEPELSGIGQVQVFLRCVDIPFGALQRVELFYLAWLKAQVMLKDEIGQRRHGGN